MSTVKIIEEHFCDPAFPINKCKALIKEEVVSDDQSETGDSTKKVKADTVYIRNILIDKYAYERKFKSLYVFTGRHFEVKEQGTLRNVIEKLIRDANEEI